MKGNARIVKGATSGAAARTQNLVRPGADGHYFLSPNASTVHIMSIGFHGGDESEFSLSDCNPSYQRDTAELTAILDCAFEVDAGTYSAMSVGLDPTAHVTVDDPTNGLFTDASSSTGLSATAPAGGATSVQVTVSSPNSDQIMSQAAFVEPLVVEEGKPVTVTLLEDMIHTMSADVQAAQLALRFIAAARARLHGRHGRRGHVRQRRVLRAERHGREQLSRHDGQWQRGVLRSHLLRER